MKKANSKVPKTIILGALFLISLAIALITAQAADPGHSAAAIDPGTFVAGNFVFQNNLTVATDALFIDDNKIETGPPPSYETIKNLIEERVKKL